MTAGGQPYVMKWIDLPAAAELFGPGAATEDGWKVPVGGQGVGYVYVGLTDLAFEIWLGGDDDVTVRIERPFTLRDRERAYLLDPRWARKVGLGPVLDIGGLDVERVLVRRSGRLEIEFDQGWGLMVEPADDGRAWSLSWPRDGSPGVACLAGGGIGVGVHGEPRLDPVDDEAADPDAAARVPVRQGSSLMLPIRGHVTEASASSWTIELAMPIRGGGRFDVHLGGTASITGGEGGAWTGDARGPAVLDLVGTRVVAAHVDDAEHLHLAFDDGRHLIAEPDAWEAHWPKVHGSLDDHWVPREGPSLP